MPETGYSGRPLSAKLGLKPGMICWRYQVPEDISALLQTQDPGAVILATPEPGVECAHVFVTERVELAGQLETLRGLLDPDGMIWVSWPKKASKQPTDITEDTIRKLCQPMGLVDVKVCAVDGIWSGLKLMIRKELRKEQAAKLAIHLAGN